MTDVRRPEPLDTTKHDRSQFDCGDPDLNDWLRRYASQNRRGNTAATWVIADERGVVVAYASLSMSGVDLSNAPAALAKKSPNPVPVLLVGRLALDRAHKNEGLGTSLVFHALTTAADTNVSVACKAVVVTALNEQALSWWERFGFRSFDPEDPECFDLYLLTDEIVRTLEVL